MSRSLRGALTFASSLAAPAPRTARPSTSRLPRPRHAARPAAPAVMSVFKNAPTSGPRYERDLPTGSADLQLYSMFTPNGNKVTILLEELGLAYDAWGISIFEGDNFSSGFLKVNPNEKIPALLDKAGPAGKDFPVMESGAIMLYIMENYAPESPLLPKDPLQRSKVLQWLFWQVGTAPYFGQFGHFFKYYKEKLEYPIARYTMETKRILDVLDKQLGRGTYVAGDDYSIADIAIYPWVRCLDVAYNATEELGLKEYKNVQRWMSLVGERPAVQLGLKINNPSDEDFKNYSSKGRKV